MDSKVANGNGGIRWDDLAQDQPVEQHADRHEVCGPSSEFARAACQGEVEQPTEPITTSACGLLSYCRVRVVRFLRPRQLVIAAARSIAWHGDG